MNPVVRAEPIYLLIHSPLVGDFTWSLVADEMRKHGLSVLVARLEDSPGSQEPYWKQHAESVSRAVAKIPAEKPIVWIAHSGAGPLVPVLRRSTANPVRAYVFVDAGLPRDGATRLDLMKSEDAHWANQFQQELERGGRFPTWSSDELSEIIPDESVRQRLAADLHPRRLDFFTEPIPVFDGWPDAPGVFILFSSTYRAAERQARQMGWPTYVLEAGHFHMLVDAPAVTTTIVDAINNLASKE